MIKNKIPLSASTKKIIRRLLKPVFFYFLSHNTEPLSNYHGFDRGAPLDRFYIENFLEQNKELIKGTCLELLNNDYTIRYGGENIIKGDVLDIDSKNKNATIIEDLRSLKKVADETYDCIILTQVLQFIDNVPAAVSECYRVLKPSGVLLATLPSLSRIDPISGVDGDYWRFTVASAKYLFANKFITEQLEIKSWGNVRSGLYFYAGLAQEDTSIKILKKNDLNFPLIITVKAIK